jgi:hypothetical protein
MRIFVPPPRLHLRASRSGASPTRLRAAPPSACWLSLTPGKALSEFLLFPTQLAWLVQLARGHTGSPYDWLLAIGGLAYIAAVAFLRWRG